MAESNVFPRKLLKKFILLYRELRCLWDRANVEYKNKNKRYDAITKLTELVQKYDPTVTRVHVLKKIECIRACVRREYNKVQDSRAKTTNPDAVHVPHLWYYDLLSFAFEEGGNAKLKPVSPEPESEEEIEMLEEDSFQQSHDSFADFNIKSNIEEVQEIPKKKYFTYEEDRTKRHRTEVDDEYDAIGTQLPSAFPEMLEEDSFQQSHESFADFNIKSNIEEVQEIPKKKYFTYEEDRTKRHRTEVNDEYDAIGINVAAKLRSLPQNMRIIAEKLINDVMYQAQTNGLNCSSVILTTDPFKHDAL